MRKVTTLNCIVSDYCFAVKAMLILFENTTKIISLVRLLSTSLFNTWNVSTEFNNVVKMFFLSLSNIS